MKISELIILLAETLKEQGDIRVLINCTSVDHDMEVTGSKHLSNLDVLVIETQEC